MTATAVLPATTLPENNPGVAVVSVCEKPEIAAKKNPSLNAIEAMIAAAPQIDFPLVHRFTPGLYAREIFMPAGAILTSKIHKTEHPYVISKGRVSVWIEGIGWERLRAPHTGITKPGTRRLLYIHEDTIWTTFHPTTETDLEVIERLLIEPHDIGGLMPADVNMEALALPAEKS